MQSSRNLKTVLAAAIALAFASATATAATISVTSADDNFQSSTCNLRNALASLRIGALQGSCTITGNFGDNDTVTFAPALVNSTITLARGELTIAGTVTIVGSGQTIDADYGSRVMYLNNATLIASNLTLTRGYASGAGRDANGAGLYLYSANAKLTDVTISHNFALGDGGGIDLQGGTVSLSQSTVSANTAVRSTGGISVYGTLAVDGSVIAANDGAKTGGIAIFSGYAGGGYGGYGSTIPSTATITRSTIDGNHAACSTSPCVGGIYSNFKNFVTIGESTISANTAAGKISRIAGGLYAYTSAITIVNSTVAHNSAQGNDYVAGALWHTGTGFNATTLTNTTVSANTATSYNGASHLQSGIMAGFGDVNLNGGDSNLQLRNSIIAGNTSGADIGVAGTHEVMTSCVAGTIANIPPLNTGSGNQFTDTPGLGPLQNNGGPTQTMALLLASVAIDAGSNPVPSTYDQRGPGFPRAFNGKIDIGAVEFQGDRIFANGFEPGP